MCAAKSRGNEDKARSDATDMSRSEGTGTPDDSIRDLYQMRCDEVSEAFMGADIPYLQSCVLLPMEIITTSSRIVISTPDQIESAAMAHIEALKAQNVTSYFRLATDAHLKDADRMVGTHTTHILRGAARVCPPFLSRTEWVLDGQTWRIIKMDLSIRDAKLPIGVPDVVPGSGSPFNF